MSKLIFNEIYKFVLKRSSIVYAVLFLGIPCLELFVLKMKASDVVTDFSIINFILIIICASIVTEEFDKGTIKMLLTKPYTRTQILVSKFLAVYLVGIVMMVIQMVVIRFLAFLQPKATIQLKMVAIQFGTSCLLLLLYLTITLLISMLTNKQAISVAVSIGFIAFGSIINSMLMGNVHSEIVNWTPFSMMNIGFLYNSVNLHIPLLQLWQYILGILVYSGIFFGISLTHFKKKDIILS
jgi:ABC-2 type transport system permease protein